MNRRGWVALIAGSLLIVGALWDNAYLGSRAVVTQARRECELRVRDRHAEAVSWYAAYLARRANSSNDPLGSRLRAEDAAAAAAYYLTARDLNARTDPKNSVQWPAGSGRHPLGLGRLDCARANPYPSAFAILGFGGSRR